MKPVFPYPGGKSRLLKEIMPFLPRENVRTYVEPFAGGLAVMLAHDKPFPREVVNDLSSGLMDFYRVAVAHPEALITELSCRIASRADFESELRFPMVATELGRAVRWFWLTKHSFGAQGAHFGRGKDTFHGMDVLSDGESIRRLSERLKKAVFRTTDACDVISEFDAPDTFFFLDPPYVACGETAYDAFSENDMARLRDTLKASKGMWLLTCDDSPATRRVFAGFHVRGTEIKYSLAKDKSGKISKELVIFSENLAEKFPGQTSLLFPRAAQNIRSSKIRLA
ncbi:MAG: DNA adenine methylase [Opitutales bacterium]|nr:DNA adenine methylase [Opitutales bacterium]